MNDIRISMKGRSRVSPGQYMPFYFRSGDALLCYSYLALRDKLTILEISFSREIILVSVVLRSILTDNIRADVMMQWYI